jgi:hypothetical protein
MGVMGRMADFRFQRPWRADEANRNNNPPSPDGYGGQAKKGQLWKYHRKENISAS